MLALDSFKDAIADAQVRLHVKLDDPPTLEDAVRRADRVKACLSHDRDKHEPLPCPPSPSCASVTSEDLPELRAICQEVVETILTQLTNRLSRSGSPSSWRGGRRSRSPGPFFGRSSPSPPSRGQPGSNRRERSPARTSSPASDVESRDQSPPTSRTSNPQTPTQPQGKGQLRGPRGGTPQRA